MEIRGTYRIDKLMKQNFEQWLCGSTDGSGSFSVIKHKNSWDLCFKLIQLTYNIKLIYLIKKILNIGLVTIEKETKVVSFKVKDRKNKESYYSNIEKNKLLTNKNFDFIVFQEACQILDTNEFSIERKNFLIKKLKNNLIQIKKKLNDNNKNLISEMTNDWLLGFWETGSSFFIVKKKEGCWIHS